MAHSIEEGVLIWEGMRIKEVDDPIYQISNNWNSPMVYSRTHDGKVKGIGINMAEIETLPAIEKEFPNLNWLIVLNGESKTLHWVQDLVYLTDLKMETCQITDLGFIQSLKEINRLKLYSNKISRIDPLENLSKIESLDLSFNLLSDISPLQQLISIKWLNLNCNHIQDLSPIQQLIQVNYLILGGNQIADIRPLKDLKNIRFLILSDNQITDIGPIQNLSEVFYLTLDGNHISDLQPLLGLTQLNDLNLSKNQISDLSQIRSILALPRLNYLYLSGNLLPTIPKELLGDMDYNCLNNLRTYFQALDAGASQSREVKIILIGNGSVGKTQIAKRLAEQENFTFNDQHDSTHAIALLQRRLETDKTEGGLDLHIWDFAGQDLYHATHRIFMQTRALIVLVWDVESESSPNHTWEGKTYKNEKLVYWLKYAKHYGMGSPILLVRNKMEQHDGEAEILLEGDIETWNTEYNILESIDISAKTGQNFDVLEYWLERAFTHDPNLYKELLEVVIPTFWITIRNQIREYQQEGKQPLMAFEEFEQLCAAAHVPDAAAVLAEYFHHSGVVFYRKGYFQNQLILDQGWVMQAIYQVLDRQSLLFRANRIKQGIVTYDLACEIWPKNSDEERELFLDFLISCELAIQIGEEEDDLTFEQRKYLIPQLLDERMPVAAKAWLSDPAHVLVQTIPFTFLPASFVHRLIMKGYHLNHDRIIWQTGLLLTDQSSFAMISADLETQTLHIHASTGATELVNRILEDQETLKREGKVNPIELNPDGKHTRNHPFFRGLGGLSSSGKPKGQKDLLRHLIIENDWDQFFEIMNSFSLEMNIQKQLTLLQARQYRLREDSRLNTISTSDKNQEFSNICLSLIQLLEEIQIP